MVATRRRYGLVAALVVAAGVVAVVVAGGPDGDGHPYLRTSTRVCQGQVLATAGRIDDAGTTFARAHA
ncbi:MAG: hypothetical protein ACRD0D_02765, partial [Acidimicrobiales bacterium]